jgi:hypothetical protein
LADTAFDGEQQLAHPLIRSGDDYAELFARGAAQPDANAINAINDAINDAINNTPTQPTDMEFKA